MVARIRNEEQLFAKELDGHQVIYADHQIPADPPFLVGICSPPDNRIHAEPNSGFIFSRAAQRPRITTSFVAGTIDRSGELV